VTNLANAEADQRIASTSFQLGTTTFLTMFTREDALKAFGTADPDFLYRLIHQVANAASKAQRIPDENCINFSSGSLDRATLAMKSTKRSRRKWLRRMLRICQSPRPCRTLEEQDSAERAFNKLLRTFAGLVEARQRYRAASDAKALETVHVERDGAGAVLGLKRRRRVRASAAARGRRANRNSSLGSSVGRVITRTHRRNTGPMLSSPRRGAKNRAGKSCLAPAVRGKTRCRMHGGAPGSGAPRGNTNAL
jgi:hypothetical protein